MNQRQTEVVDAFLQLQPGVPTSLPMYRTMLALVYQQGVNDGVRELGDALDKKFSTLVSESAKA